MLQLKTGQVGTMDYQQILKKITRQLAASKTPITAWVAGPYSEDIIRAVEKVQTQGLLAKVVLVGDGDKIPRIPASFEHVNVIEPAAIAQYVAENSGGSGNLVVKGNISSSALLKAVLKGGGGKAVASHAYIIKSPSFPDRTILVADAGVNIQPDLKTKIEILHNTLTIARKVGIEVPRVAILSAVESINPSMQSTIDAASLMVMAARRNFGNAQVDGPMAIDAAMMPASAATKNLHGEVAGQANVLLLDDIEAANSTAKALIGAVGQAMGVIVGAGKVVAFPSRGDSEETRYHSLLLAAFLSS